MQQFQNVDGYGTYIQWFGNTALYAVIGGVGATALSAFAGYGFSRFSFRGSKVPGFMTVLLISVVAVWNNYFLPLLIFNVNTKYPLVVGLGLWSERAQNSGNAQLFPMVVIGGLVTIIPLIALFLLLQRYWRGGLLLGSIAN